MGSLEEVAGVPSYLTGSAHIAVRCSHVISFALQHARTRSCLSGLRVVICDFVIITFSLSCMQIYISHIFLVTITNESIFSHPVASQTSSGHLFVLLLVECN
jgi:hypothetical protein